MPVSNAEWQKLYRLKRDADPTRHAEYLKKTRSSTMAEGPRDAFVSIEKLAIDE